METFRIAYDETSGKDTEEVEADEFFEEAGDIIIFYRDTVAGAEKVLTLKCGPITRIEATDLGRFEINGQYKVTYAAGDPDPEVVRADEYHRDGSAIVFIRNTAAGEKKTLWLREALVDRVDEA